MKKISFKKIANILLTVLFVALMCTITSYATGGPYERLPEAWKSLMEEYRYILAGITGTGVLTAIIVFMYHTLQLAAVSNNPKRRAYCISGMTISLITTMLLGSVTLIFTIFYNTIFK